MKIEQTARLGWSIIKVTGRADAVAAQELEEVLQAAAKPSSKVAVDLSTLDYISSAGLRSLLQGARAAQVNAAEFVVCGAKANVKNVLEISGMQHIMRVEDVLPC